MKKAREWIDDQRNHDREPSDAGLMAWIEEIQADAAADAEAQLKEAMDDRDTAVHWLGKCLAHMTDFAEAGCILETLKRKVSGEKGCGPKDPVRCGYCGCKAYWQPGGGDGGNVVCANCGSHGPSAPSLEEAIKKWDEINS